MSLTGCPGLLAMGGCIFASRPKTLRFFLCVCKNTNREKNIVLFVCRRWWVDAAPDERPTFYHSFFSRLVCVFIKELREFSQNILIKKYIVRCGAYNNQ